ncbi:MAG TPA: hypothetical protein VGU74_07345 [Gemmatimonadales bacterium]|nr:hypothetical protein [Gemmatimonadales bacterium]
MEFSLMKPSYQLVAVLCASVALSTSACGDRTTTGPGPAAMQASVTGGDPHHDHHKHHVPPGLVRCRAQKPQNEHQRIGPDGGSIEVGPYTLTVPPGALTRAVTISARIRPGESVNVVEFKPKGLVFETSASLSMSYSNCEVEDTESPQIAVVDDAYTILYYLPSTQVDSSQQVSGQVPQLTNYAVAW